MKLGTVVASCNAPEELSTLEAWQVEHRAVIERLTVCVSRLESVVRRLDGTAGASKDMKGPACAVSGLIQKLQAQLGDERDAVNRLDDVADLLESLI